LVASRQIGRPCRWRLISSYTLVGRTLCRRCSPQLTLVLSEQGPILEAAGQKIGIVEGVQASRWFTIGVQGRDAHTGATDFANRSDALLASTKMILRSHQVATAHKSLASTGLLSLAPGSTNTVPGLVKFSLDLRSSSDETISVMERTLRSEFEQIAQGLEVGALNAGCTAGLPCKVSWSVDQSAKVAQFDSKCISCIEDSANAMLDPEGPSLIRRMFSGAGHDSVHTSTRVPTAMIFVPCREGLTHNPAEYTSPEDCGNGAQVLLGSVLRFDRLRGAQ
jgi:hydantoinase/carbamoylase family amidase